VKTSLSLVRFEPPFGTCPRNRIKRTCRVSRWKQIHVPARLPFEWSAVNDVEAIAGQQRVQTRVALLGIWDQYL
jgi:hypothetical protein